MAQTLEINSLTPVSECLKEVSRKAQHVRFKRRAEIFQTSGEINVLTSAVKANAKATGQLFGFDTSKTSHYGLFRLLDKATHKIVGGKRVVEEGTKLPFEQFDWRTFIFFRFPTDLLIEEIEAYVGNKWVVVDLRNRRFWAAAPQDKNGIASFISAKKELAELEKRQNYLKNRRSKGRKILDPAEAPYSFVEDGVQYEIRRTNNTTEKMVDKDGNVISKDRIIQENKEVCLVGDFKIAPNERKSPPSTKEEVFKEEAEYFVLSKQINAIYDEIREIELSLVEDLFIARMYGEISEANGMSFEYGGVNFTVNFSDASDYDYSREVKDKFQSGEYVYEEMEANPQWRCYELGADVPSTNVKETDSETVNA